MTDETSEQQKKGGRRKMTIEEEIAHLAKKLAEARARQKKEEEERQRANERAVISLIKSANLLKFGVDAWKGATAEIVAALKKAEAASGSPQSEQVEPAVQSTADDLGSEQGQQNP